MAYIFKETACSAGTDCLSFMTRTKLLWHPKECNIDWKLCKIEKMSQRLCEAVYCTYKRDLLHQQAYCRPCLGQSRYRAEAMQKQAAGLTYRLLDQLVHCGSLERLLQVQHLALVGNLSGATDCLHANNAHEQRAIGHTSCETSEELSHALPCSSLDSGKGHLWVPAVS